MKRILIAVTGGISAYKAVDVISALKKNNFHVSVMATENSLQFVSENVLKITADKYWGHAWSSVVHILATEEVDVFAVVPATANMVAKITYGMADDLVSSSCLALPATVDKMIFPAMNTRMWLNPIFQKNLVMLREYGWKVMKPASGELACGTEGIGKLPSTKDIVDYIIKNIGPWKPEGEQI
jgi:phosphopantothenoylcysteine synthetase/decarboxylase